MEKKLSKNKIERLSVVDQVANMLKQMIISKELKPGDKLPSESDIAQMYNVNRLSVRMALQKLATLGVIETRVGEGSFVRAFSIFPVLDEISDYYDSENRMEEIQQMRHLIEAASVSEAILKAGEDEMDALKQCLDQYLSALDDSRKKGTDDSFRRLVETDFGLHAQIVHMSHNHLFEEIYYMVQSLIMAHIKGLLQMRNVITDEALSEDFHSNLCRYIFNRDMEGAQNMIHIIICGDSQFPGF